MGISQHGLEILGLNFGWPNLLAFGLSSMTVVLLVYGRHEIRIRRLGALRDYIRTYPHTASMDPMFDSHPDDADPDPSFEYAKSKYSSDLQAPQRGPTPQERIEEIEGAMRRAYFFRGSTPRILAASVGYWLVTYGGFLALFTNVSCDAGENACHPLLSLLTAGATAASSDPAQIAGAMQLARNSLMVGSFAFLGAYAASVRYMLRSLSTFDLNAFTFIRQGAMITVTTLLAIALYRAVPDLGVDFGLSGTREAGTDTVPLLWLLMAVSLGLLPASIFQFILTRAGTYLSWTKSSDDRFLEWTRIVPLDVIDGIDYFTRFRLEECGISDVQALATYNPIMLHIETPYRIYQALDWITQAQLCCSVGLDRFLLLRQFNIRTIFDLERAIKADRSNDKERTAALDMFDQIYAGILFSPNSNMRGIEEISKVNLLIPDGPGTREVTASEYCSWARAQINSSPEMLSVAIEHLMNWISDDLHVRRARRIWNEISVQLGTNSLTLFDDAAIRATAARASRNKTEKADTPARSSDGDEEAT